MIRVNCEIECDRCGRKENGKLDLSIEALNGSSGFKVQGWRATTHQGWVLELEPIREDGFYLVTYCPGCSRIQTKEERQARIVDGYDFNQEV